MRKNVLIVIGIVVVIIIVIGGYFVYHKSYKAASPSASTNAQGSTAVVNNAVVSTKNDASVGNYLVNANGNTLYTYTSDTANTSNCTGSCLSSWPAYQDTGTTANLPTNIGTLKRNDNSQIQYTYKGMPLYAFTGDGKGQVTGNGVGGFEVARP